VSPLLPTVAPATDAALEQPAATPSPAEA
jgi:hypothetical protein